MSGATTVRDALFGGADGAAARTELGSSLADLGTAISPLVPVSDIADALWELIDLPFGDIVRGAWERHRSITEAEERTAAMSGTVERVRLGSHTVQVEHRPRLEFEVAGATLPALELQLLISLTFEAVVLTIADGRIREIAPARGIGDLSIAAAGRPIVERRLVEVTVPALLPSA